MAKFIHHIGYLIGGDILTLPAESIAQTIHERKIIIFMQHHQVTAVKVFVTFPEHIAADFFFRGLRVVHVTGKTVQFVYLTQQQTGFPGLTFDRPAVLISLDMIIQKIIADYFSLAHAGQVEVAAHSRDLFHVQEGSHPFRGTVDFIQDLDVEPFPERNHQVATHTIASYHA